MALFLCSTCGCVDDTALTDYFQRRVLSARTGESFRPLCSECGHGEWHNRFPKRSATGMFVSKDGYLFTEASLMRVYGDESAGRGIVGRVGENGQIDACGRPKRLPRL